MNGTDSIMIAQPIDKTQMPPLHQKRIVAFVNHFLISSCSFLNEFASKCESKFIELERKIQKVEAALTILEAKLASVPDAATKSEITAASKSHVPVVASETTTADATLEPQLISVDSAEETTGVPACEDMRYKKFFKMVQFGVPAEAVKLKMHAEGLNPTVLDAPNFMLTDVVS